MEKFTEELASLDSMKLDYDGEEKKKIGCLTVILWILFYWILIPYHIIRICLAAYRDPDFDGVDKRKQGRSKYGAKRPKPGQETAAKGKKK